MKSLILTLAAVITPALAQGQTPEDVAAYLSVMRTPAGALAPMLTNTLLERVQNGASLAFRYGNLANGDINPGSNTFAVTGVLPAGLGSSLNVTGGVITSDCTGCKAELMLGIGGDIRLIGSAMGTASTSPLFTASLTGEMGYSNADPGSFFSGYVGAPLALVQRGTGMQFVPFITPGFGIGRISANGNATSGAVTMVGGGLGIYNSLTGVVVNLGLQHAFTSGGKTSIGVNVLVGGK